MTQQMSNNSYQAGKTRRGIVERSQIHAAPSIIRRREKGGAIGEAGKRGKKKRQAVHQTWEGISGLSKRRVSGR